MDDDDEEETEPIKLLVASVKKYQFQKDSKLKINEKKCCSIFYKNDTCFAYTDLMSSPFISSSSKTEEWK